MSTITPNVSRSADSPTNVFGHGTAAACGVAQEASPRQVEQWMRSGEAVLIDVREQDEHAREHIGGSRLVPLSRFGTLEVRSLTAPGQRIVLHCKSGRRSADAARMAISLAADGYSVMTMAGGIEAWKKDHLAVEIDTGVSGVSVMRQVQMVIGTGVLAGSSLAWFVHPAFMALPAFFGAGLLFAGITGTCGLGALLGGMPWNKGRGNKDASACAAGACR